MSIEHATRVDAYPDPCRERFSFRMKLARIEGIAFRTGLSWAPEASVSGGFKLLKGF